MSTAGTPGAEAFGKKKNLAGGNGLTFDENRGELIRWETNTGIDCSVPSPYTLWRFGQVMGENGKQNP